MLSKVCGLAVLAVCAVAQAASISRADKEFMNTVARLDMTGAHEGQMAENQASSPQVKDFAKMLVQDDSESYGHLAELAAKSGVPIPKGIDTGKIPTVRVLAALHGSRFDRAFTGDAIAAQQRAIAVFKHEAKYGQDADVKAYAGKMISVFENNLKRAEECARPARRS
jgi:putative membrane protein